MTLAVQDDTGLVANANGYLSVAEFKTYHNDRGNAYTLDDSAITTAIVRATDFLDRRYRYRGRPLNGRDQLTEWPRVSCWDRYRNSVNGIPREVKEATAEYALRALTLALSPDPDYSAVGGTVVSKREKVGPIEEATTFTQGGTFTMPRYPMADRLLTGAGLTESGGEVRRG